jgi:hypothetical protein
MGPDRHRRGTAGEPLWGSTRLLVAVVVLAVVLGMVVGLAAYAKYPQQRLAPAPTTSQPMVAAPPSTTLVVRRTAATPSTAAPSPTRTTTAPPASTSPTGSSSSSTATTSEALAHPDIPILQQRRPAPDGVLDQMLSTFGGAGGDSLCDTASRILHPGRIDKPTVAIGTDQRPNFAVLEVAHPIQLCLWRFEAGHPIHVSIRDPNGRVTTSLGYPPSRPPCSDNCYSHVNWAAVPGDPLGDYDVTAVQGLLRAVGMVRVVPATMRRLLVVGNGIDEQEYQTFQRGEAVRIAIAGYGPRRGVQLFVYYTPERALQLNVPTLRFLTWIQLRAGSHGGVTYDLRTVADDRPGCYALDARPRPQELGPVEEGDPFTHAVMLVDKDTAPLFCLA